jgi:hypothetical protein
MAIVHLETGQEEGGDESEAEQIDELRRRSATALERAWGFLKSQDDHWARVRAEVLCEARPAAELASQLGALQDGAGRLPVLGLVAGGGLGFPPTPLDALTSDQSGLLGTLEALLIAGDAKVLHAGWVEPAARYLESRQEADGAFHIPTLLEDTRGREEAEIFWTGSVAGILGRTPAARTSLLEAAGAFLGERFTPEIVEGSYSALCAYAHFFTNVHHDLADEALQWCGRALEKGFRSRQLDALSTLRVLLTCDAQAMPGATFDAVEMLDRLLEEQAGDGGFAELSPGGPPTRTTQTFDAMLAIVRLCGGLGA